jgi:hypothetical protein
MDYSLKAMAWIENAPRPGYPLPSFAGTKDQLLLTFPPDDYIKTGNNFDCNLACPVDRACSSPFHTLGS